jgi:hypothetical protein
MSLKDLKPHVVSTNMEEYIQIIVGVRKTGKTTLFKNLVIEKYGSPNAGLLLAFEMGYKALNDVVPIDVEDWSHFENLIDELVYSKDEMPYKIIGIDTIDEMVNMAEQYTIKFFNRKADIDKRAATINEAGGGYNRGKQYAISILRNALNKLQKAGYGIFLIGHSKEKKKKTTTGVEYVQLSCNLTDDYNDVLLNSADFITFLTTEKTVEGTALTNEQVFMNFRGYEFDCGSRLYNVPKRIEYDVKKYIEVFESAVKELVSEKGKNFEEVKEQQKIENKEKAKKEIEKIKAKEMSEIIFLIKGQMKQGLQNNTLTTDAINELLAKYDLKSPDDLKDKNIAVEILNSL